LLKFAIAIFKGRSRMQKVTDHKRITDLVKVKMRALDIVFPRRYTMLFSDVAKEHGIDLGPEETLTDDLLDDKVVRHVEKLSDSANKAVDAIKEQDQERLQEVLEETKALREEIEELRSAVYEDALTKVYNRRWMSENYLSEDQETFQNEGMLAMIDLNDFKHVNDTYGHIIGDRVLFFIASQLRRSGGDVVRYGGDEFFVFFGQDSSKEKARLIMHNIREAIIKRKLNADGKKFNTSFSYGIAEFIRGNTMESVVQLADEEMYQDKKQIKKRLSEEMAI